MNKLLNIKGLNGLYLTYSPSSITIENYRTELFVDNNFFPKSINDSNLFNLKNSKYENNYLTGSNSLNKSNTILKHSEIIKENSIISGKLYYNTFKLYFRFYGSDINGYKMSSEIYTVNNTFTEQILSRLRLKGDVVIGSNIIPLKFANLEKYISGTTWDEITSYDVITGDTATGTTIETGCYGIELITGDTGDMIDMGYPYTGITNTGKTDIISMFESYNSAPNQFNFRVDVSIPNFSQKAGITKEYKLIIKYYNIGVKDVKLPDNITNSPYAISENIEMTSQNYIFYVPNDFNSYVLQPI